MEVLLTEDMEAGRLCADPEIAFSIFGEGEDAVGAEGWLKLGMAVSAVQDEQSFVGADPSISARVCQEGLDACGRQIVAGLQGLLMAALQQDDPSAGSQPEAVIWKSADAQDGLSCLTKAE